jgi:beta-glucosidase
MTMKEKALLCSGSGGWAMGACERLGVFPVRVTDGPHGIRLTKATAFPSGVSMAASWNRSLIHKVGQALAEETRAAGFDIILGPCVNIARHPLAGRNFESLAEDPHLAGQIGVAYVQGVQSKGVGTSLKHFACNNQEHLRGKGDSVVDERTLREIYLPAFETIVKESDPWTVMCSYNRLNGEHASQNKRLLTDILRTEWGYAGVVISDWSAVHTTRAAFAAGLDVVMPDSSWMASSNSTCA